MQIDAPSVPATHASSELDRLGDEIAELSAHLDAATARLLTLIREFDARGGCAMAPGVGGGRPSMDLMSSGSPPGGGAPAGAGSDTVCAGYALANPFGQGRPTPGHGVVDVPRLLTRAPLGVREAHEDALLAGIRDHGVPSTFRYHDIMKSTPAHGRGSPRLPAPLPAAARS